MNKIPVNVLYHFCLNHFNDKQVRPILNRSAHKLQMTVGDVADLFDFCWAVDKRQKDFEELLSLIKLI